jgi:putative DNA primase/helicase
MQERCLPFASITAVLQALSVAIDDNRFHPVRDYLDKLPEWDKTPRLDIWLSYYLGVEPIEHYTGPIGKCWLISAVARIYQPGCQAKYCPILEGEQDLGKSEALAILGGEWFTDDIAELGTKDAAMQVGNAWIAELSELDSVRKAYVASMKAFISRKVDQFRKPFGRHVIAQERQCVMAGILNPGGEPFVDETGNVRFWPVLCLKIDLDALKHDRDQLWAEAVYRYKQREKWWLENEDTIRVAREQQDERLIVDSWGDVIKNYLDNHSEIKATTTTYILRDALGMHVRDHDRARQSRVGIVMRRHMKWNSRKSGSRRWFERPGEINTTYPENPDLNKSTSPAAPPKSPVSWPADFSDAEPQHTFR